MIPKRGAHKQSILINRYTLNWIEVVSQDCREAIF